MMAFSMVVHNFDIFGAGGGPSEADSELVIDSYAVLPGPVSAKQFQAVSRRHAKVAEPHGDLQLSKLAPRD
jgi:hypothetical protein